MLKGYASFVITLIGEKKTMEEMKADKCKAGVAEMKLTTAQTGY